MKSSPYCLLTLAAVLAIGVIARGQGPDVIVGDLSGIQSYSASGGISAYAIGTTSCNVGTTTLSWVASTPAHPVIGQNIYRVKDGKFEQIGISWLKHGFTALQGNLCTPCSPNPNGSALGVGCSDPYSSGLNGSQSGLGPRYQVNPTSGVFPYPFASHPMTIPNARRILVPTTDVLPAQNPGAAYFGEGHYIAADDAQAGNGFNNASYCALTFSGSGSASISGATVREEPAIMAWPTVNSTAQVVSHDINGQRFYVGFNFRSLGGGMTEYIYAVHNLNSDRAAGGFSVATPAGAVVQNPTFHGTASHSGSVWQNTTPWSSSITSNGVGWTTQSPFNTNVHGRAIRWGQTFTFTFESNQAPGAVTVDMFKPGGAASFTINPFSVPTEEWQVNGAPASMDINGNTNSAFVGAIQTTVPFGAASTLNYGSVVAGAPFDIIYQPGDAVSINNGGILYWPNHLLNIDLFDPARPWALVFNGFTSNMPGGPVSIPFAAPSAALDICAQLAIIDAGSPIGVSFSAANNLDVLPCAGTTLSHTLLDDNSVNVTVGPGGDHDCVGSLSFYGTTYTDVYINSNGSLSFGVGLGDFSATVPEFLNSAPRFAGMWTDLSPNIAGTITSTSSPGVLTVSFNGVPEYNSPATSSFDMVADTINGIWSVASYAPGGGHGTATIVGVTPGGGAAGPAVNYSLLPISVLQPYPAGQAIYQWDNNSAVTGFSHLDFVTTGSLSVTRQ